VPGVRVVLRAVDEARLGAAVSELVKVVAGLGGEAEELAFTSAREG